MTSKTSLSEKLFEKALFFSDLKRFWWLSGLYFVTLLFILPFYFLIQGAFAEDQWQIDALKDTMMLTPNYNDFQILLIYAVPVLLAVLLFKYLHSSRATAAVHSLPVTRNKLFFTHCTAGIILLALPVILTALTLAAVGQADFLREVYSMKDIFLWTGQTLLFIILFFAGAVFVGMFTGNPLTHIAFTYILLALPYGLYDLVRYNLSSLLHGYSSANLYQNFIDSLPPYILLNGGLDNTYFTPARIGEYLLLIAAVFAMALYAYRLRKLEAAGDVIAFTPIKPIFKYGVTICCTLVGGGYFANVTGLSEGALPWIIFGYFLCSLLGYFIAEGLIQKSVKVWPAYKGYLGYAALLVLALLVVQTDVFGFVQRVPKPEEVTKVFFGSNISAWSALQEDSIKTAEEKASYYASLEGPEYFQEPGNIENIISLHKLLVHDIHADKGRQIYIVYSLKNGKRMIREYTVNGKEYAPFLKPIYESDEYKEARFPVLRQNPNQVKMLEIADDSRTSKKPVLITDSKEISQLMGALRKDLARATYEEMLATKSNYPRITVTDLKDKSIDYMIRDSYSSVTGWLKQKGYFEKCILQPEEIEYATLEKSNAAPEDNRQRLEIRDPKLIKELLDINAGYEFTENTIMVEFQTKHNSFQEFINKDTKVSPELKKYLEKLR